MTNDQLNVLLATALDRAANNRETATKVMKRYALAQAIGVEEQLGEDDKHVLAAVCTLYDLNNDAVSELKGVEGNPYQPIAVNNFIRLVLEEVSIPEYETASIQALIGLKDYGNDIDNELHKLCREINLLVELDKDDLQAEDIKKYQSEFTSAAGTRRFNEMYSEYLTN